MQMFCNEVFILLGELLLLSEERYIQEPFNHRTGTALFIYLLHGVYETQITSLFGSNLY